MTLRETTALVLLFRACPDEALKRKVLGLLPELGELIETATDTVKSQHRVLSRRLYGEPRPDLSPNEITAERERRMAAGVRLGLKIAKARNA